MLDQPKAASHLRDLAYSWVLNKQYFKVRCTTSLRQLILLNDELKEKKIMCSVKYILNEKCQMKVKCQIIKAIGCDCVDLCV